MIREETAAVAMPYLMARFHPALSELQALLDQKTPSAIGSIEQITLERSLPRRNRDSVLRQFARDVDILQVLAGNATKLHAFASDLGWSISANISRQSERKQKSSKSCRY